MLPYHEEKIPSEKEYIAKKFNISTQELDGYLSQAPKTYKDFPNQKNWIQWFYKLYKQIFGLKMCGITGFIRLKVC
jgi:hypothetical protein